VSCWIDAGLSPKTVQTFAGHSTLSVTNTDGHLFRWDDQKAAMDAIALEIVSEAPFRASDRPNPAQRCKGIYSLKPYRLDTAVDAAARLTSTK
jgi:hypothetical protein